MITAVYVGEDRPNRKENHEMFFNELKKHFDVDIKYRYKAKIESFDDKTNKAFVKSEIKRWRIYESDEFKDGKAAHPSCIMDFLKNVQDIKSEFILKMRPDVWFTKKCIPYVIKDIKRVINNEEDFILMGNMCINLFDKEYEHYPVINHSKFVGSKLEGYKEDNFYKENGWPTQVGGTTDFIFIVKKDCLNDLNEMREILLKSDRNNTSNVWWKKICKEGTRSFWSTYQMFLLRTPPKDLPSEENKYNLDYWIAWDWIRRYKKNHYDKNKTYFKKLMEKNNE